MRIEEVKLGADDEVVIGGRRGSMEMDNISIAANSAMKNSFYKKEEPFEIRDHTIDE